MSVLVIGDVHGCADELEELLQRAAPDRVVLVGDLFTKGPDPAGVWRIIRDNPVEAVLGNHDDHLLRLIDRGRVGNSGAHRTLARLDQADPDWEGWVRRLPLFSQVANFVVVHAGLHPSGDIKRTKREMALLMRRWPTEEDHQPLWWQVYEGASNVVFGHDARRGYVRRDRDGQPWLVGLDSGCVYGGQLTGYFPERDAVVQVQARRPYKSFT